MYTSLERYIPLFENYLKSENPKAFIDGLNDATEKTIISVLTENTTDVSELRKKVRQIGFPRSLEEALIELRFQTYLRQVDKIEDNEISR